MEHVSIIPKDFFAGPKITESAMNCNVNYFVDNLQNPTNLCVKQLGGVAPAWCCKYTDDLDGQVKGVSKCWATCPEWEKEASELKI